MKKNRKTTTVTTTKLNVREALERATSLTDTLTGVLTNTEEHVLRMRHGVSVPGNAPLALRGQHNPETRAKLAHLEQLALDIMSAPQPSPEPVRENGAKAHMIRRLRGEE